MRASKQRSVERGAISTDRTVSGSHNVIVQLSPDQPSKELEPGRPGRQRRPGRLAASASVVGMTVLLIWALTTPGGYFWPSWVWLGLLIPFAVVGGIRLALRAPRRRALASAMSRRWWSGILIGCG